MGAPQLLGELPGLGVQADSQDVDPPAFLLDDLGALEKGVIEAPVGGVVAAVRRRFLDAVGDQQEQLAAFGVGVLFDLFRQYVQCVADVREAAVGDLLADDPPSHRLVRFPSDGHGHRHLGLAVEGHHQKEVPGNQDLVDQVVAYVLLDRLELADHGQGLVQGHDHVDRVGALLGTDRQTKDYGKENQGENQPSHRYSPRFGVFGFLDPGCPRFF